MNPILRATVAILFILSAPVFATELTTLTTPGTRRSNDWAGDLGFQFTVGPRGMTVTSLGRWKLSGNSAMRTVKLLQRPDNSTIASVTVDLSMGSAGTFIYAACTEVELTPYTSYAIVSTEQTGGSTEQWYNNDTDLTLTADAALDGAFYESSPGVYALIGGDGFVPLSLEYTLLPFVPSPAYYVDKSRSANGNGTEANPWKDLSDLSWVTISNSLSLTSVVVYFSSRDVWPYVAGNFVGATGSSSNWLSIVGDEKYNLTDSGTASWQTESTGSRAVITNGTGSGSGTWTITNSTSFVKLAGWHIRAPAFGGMLIGDSNPSTNIHDIILTNIIVRDGPNNAGISAVFLETNCHSITVSHCTVSNFPAEAIYIGHFNYLTQSITNVIVERCATIDCGTSGEGEIELKPPVWGGIVRYCTNYRTSPLLGGASCGVIVAGNNFQIYGNTFFSQKQGPDTDWGYGIQVNADGDTVTGVNITNGLIYNNLLYGNQSAGIRVIATTAPGAVSGLKIYNNTIVDNQRIGLELRSSNSRAVTIAELRNNIVVGNTTYDVSLQNTDCAIALAERNLYRSSGNQFYYQGTEKSFAQWQALGFDGNGVNSDPLLNAAFRPIAGSPAALAGTNLTSVFTVDHNTAARPAVVNWTIGAFEGIGSRPPVLRDRHGKSKVK